MAGSRIAGITIEIGGDTTKLQDALKGVNTQIRDTQNNLKDVERLLKLDPSHTELLAQKQSLLKEKITMESIAAFRKTDGRFNLVFLESQKPVIEKVLGTFIPKADAGTLKLKL